MMNEAAFTNRLSIIKRLLQCVENEVGLGGSRSLPTNDAVGESVDHKGNVDESLPCRHIGEIADPEPVWCWRPELAVYLVLRARL